MINIGYSEVLPCYSPCSPYVFFFRGANLPPRRFVFLHLCDKFSFPLLEECLHHHHPRSDLSHFCLSRSRKTDENGTKKRNHGLEAMVAWCCMMLHDVAWCCMMLHDVAVQETKKLNHVAVWSWYDHDMIQWNMYLSNWKNIRLHRTHVFYIGSVLKQGAMKQSLNVAHQCNVHAKHATIIHVSQAYHRYMSRCFMIYTFAANPMFARIGSRISFDMLRSLRRASVFFLLSKAQQPNKTKSLKT